MKSNHKSFGLDRVLSPKDVVPVAAWKLDNSMEVREREAKLKVEHIHLECDNFQQICTACGYDEDKIKAKILDIIEKRGKLHNPFTKTGGVLLGTLEKKGENFSSDEEVEIGDKIYCITSIGGLPLKIYSIDNIDYNYGQLTCKGEAIIFDSSPIKKATGMDLDPSFTLAAIDEAGSIYGAYKLALEKKYSQGKYIIIGKSIYTTMLYGAALREAIGEEREIVAVMDEHINDSLTHEEIENIMKPLIRNTYFGDLTRPIAAFKEIVGEDASFFDGIANQVIVAEDIFGAEALAVSLVRPLGDIYFSSVANHYGTASLIAENMGKEINMHAFDQYSKDYPEFTLRIILNIRGKLEELNRLYDSKKEKKGLSESRERSMRVLNGGSEDDFVYLSMVTKNMVDEVLNIAKYDCNVIIQGETGVGKEKVLSLIHQNSQRRSQPCIKINCATIQENLAESEFFGYEGGAFTGASEKGKKGYFEMANNGILFLDEIGSLSMNMQSKLLRVLQESQFYRVGGNTQITVNVRVIVANNINLKKMVEEGLFREDLYYRLSICTIDVPPLRDRRDDIISLAEAFVSNWSKKYKIEKEISPEALKALYYYYWPGNVRELENVIHRLVISSKDVVINHEDVNELLNENTYGDIVLNVRKSFNKMEKLDFHQLMEQQEIQILEYALKKEGTTRKAAEFLGLPQTTFARKKLKYNL